MRRILSLILIVMAMLAVVGCGGRSDDGEKAIRVGISLPSFDNTFQLYLMDAIKKHAASLEQKVDLTFVDAKNDSAMQLNQVENFITQGVDAIIVVTTSAEATGPMSNAALSEGIPLVYLNARPAEVPDGLHYVGSQEKVAGNLQMEYVSEKLGEKGNVAILMGDLVHEASYRRTDGVKEIADKYPDIKIIKEQTGKWERALGMSVTENWLNSRDKIDAIIANNDEMAIGAIKALEGANLLGKVLVLGVDATDDGIAELEKGNLSATVFQDAVGQGSSALDVALKVVNGEEVEKDTWIPFKLVTLENYKEIMKK